MLIVVKGICVDGACISRDDWSRGIGFDPLIGQKKILVIDFDRYPSNSIPLQNKCHSHNDAHQTVYDGLESFYDAMAKKYLNKDTSFVDFSFETYGPFTSSDVGLEPSANNGKLVVDKVAQLCNIDMSRYHEIILSGINVGAHGYAGKPIVMESLDDSYTGVLIHELGHNFGCNDQYNLAGSLQLAGSVHGRHRPIDYKKWDIQVCRGELGWVDADRNGVIDVSEFSYKNNFCFGNCPPITTSVPTIPTITTTTSTQPQMPTITPVAPPKYDTTFNEKITDTLLIHQKKMYAVDISKIKEMRNYGWRQEYEVIVLAIKNKTAKFYINGEIIDLTPEGTSLKLINGIELNVIAVDDQKVKFEIIPPLNQPPRGKYSEAVMAIGDVIGSPDSDTKLKVEALTSDTVELNIAGRNQVFSVGDETRWDNRNIVILEINGKEVRIWMSEKEGLPCEAKGTTQITDKTKDCLINKVSQQERQLVDDECDDVIFRDPRFKGCNDAQRLFETLECVKNKFPQTSQKISTCLASRQIPEEQQQICNVQISQPLLYAVSLNPSGICMGGELQDIIVPPAFVDVSGRPIPNLRPDGVLNQNGVLSCKIPCSVPVKRTCLRDLGVTTQGANYEVNPVDRSKCGDITLQPMPPIPQTPVAIPAPIPPTTLPSTPQQQCNGCEINNRCLSLGVRLIDDKGIPAYCDWDKTFKQQKQENQACQNNYECVSNTCADNKCQSVEARIQAVEKQLKEQQTILQKIMDFFKRMFGG